MKTTVLIVCGAALAAAECQVSIELQLSTHECKLGEGYGCFENATMWADGFASRTSRRSSR